MDFTTFLNHFDTIAQAPNGIAKLRSLILSLAAQGKLVPQNLDYKPAMPQKVLQSDNLPYPLPKNWVDVKLGDVVDFIGGSQPPKSQFIYEEKPGYVRLVQIRDFKTDEFKTYVPKEYARRPFEEDDIMIGRYGPPVFQILRGLSGTYNVALMKAQPTINTLSKDYLYYLLQEPRIQNIVIADSSRTAGQSGVRKELLNEIIAFLPPLAEQKRIVEKVDELMALCDRYQQSQEAQDKLRQKLRESAIASLMNAETDEELQKSWSIVRDNWQTLSQKPEDVGDLRRSILQLAVQGKLVKQNPRDSSASVALKKSKTKNKVGLEHLPFKIPQTWQWVRLGEVSEHCLGKMLDKQKNKGTPLPYLRNLNVRWLTFDLSDILEMPFEEHELERFGVEIGDVLICEGGEPGRAAIWEGRIPNIKFQKAIHRVRPFESLYNRFLVYCLLVDAKAKRLETYFTGATFKHFTGQELAKYLLPLPPLAEQKRIVAKVDELMQMCDRLEESLRQSQQRIEALAASAISHLTI